MIPTGCRADPPGDRPGTARADDSLLDGLGEDCRVGIAPEQPMTGGAQARGLVKVGMTVRRPSYPRADFVDALWTVPDLVDTRS